MWPFKKNPAPVVIHQPTPTIEVIYFNKDKKPVLINIPLPTDRYIYNKTGKDLVIDHVIDVIKEEEGMSFVKIHSIRL